MSDYTDLQTFITTYVQNYPVQAFHDLRMQGILLRMMALFGGGGSGSGSNSAIIPFVSANFSNATDCPVISMNGRSFQLFWNEDKRFLEQDAGEWGYLAGGGFTILIPGFDSSTDNFHFKVFPQ